MSELTMSAHPSTITNSNSLNGNDTSTGGSMNMPIDISVELTIEVDDEEWDEDHEPDDERGLQLREHERGDSAVICTLSRGVAASRWLAAMNRLSSLWRVCSSMKSRSGTCALS